MSTEDLAGIPGRDDDAGREGFSEELRSGGLGPSLDDGGETVSRPATTGTYAPTDDSADDSADDGLLDPGEIDALVGRVNRGHSTRGDQPSRHWETERLLDEAEANLAAAMGDAPRSLPDGAHPFEFDEFDAAGTTDDPRARLDSLEDVELDLRIELGRTELLIEEVLKLKAGSVVPLDKLAGDPVDVLVNGRLVARGEVLVLNDNFCVRIAEILTPDY
ncbi:MAG: flagellar motor switch protein FliN [Planctomycetaceae bacterium]